MRADSRGPSAWRHGRHALVSDYDPAISPVLDLLNLVRPEWFVQAKCRGMGSDFTDMTTTEQVEFCAGCVVTRECIDHCVDTAMRVGHNHINAGNMVWGGKRPSEQRRRYLAKKKKKVEDDR